MAFSDLLDRRSCKKFITSIVKQLVPPLLFGGSATREINEFIEQRHLQPHEVQKLKDFEKFFDTNRVYICDFIIDRLSVVSVLTLERIILGHELCEDTLNKLSLSVVTCFLAFIKHTNEDRLLDHVVSTYMMKLAELINVERALLLNNFKVNHLHMPLKLFDGTKIDFIRLPCFERWAPLSSPPPPPLISLT